MDSESKPKFPKIETLPAANSHQEVAERNSEPLVSPEIMQAEIEASALQDVQALEDARQVLDEAMAEHSTYTLRVVSTPELLAERQAEDWEVLEGRSKEVSLESKKGRELMAALHDVAKICDALGVWKLDGALNISLREIAKGSSSFFRNHRDVDAHVFGLPNAEELSAVLAGVRSSAAPNGYAAFVRKGEGGSMQLVKCDNGNIPRSGIQLFKLDQDGSPYIEITGVPIDVHFDVEKSEMTGLELPREWQNGGGRVAIGNGEVGLDHPGSVLYHKLLTGRPHDISDIDFMLKHGQIDSNDIATVHAVLLQDQNGAKHRDQKIAVAQAIDKLTSLHVE